MGARLDAYGFYCSRSRQGIRFPNMCAPTCMTMMVPALSNLGELRVKFKASMPERCFI